ICGQTRFFEAYGLRFGEHTEGAADFHSQRCDATHHSQHVLEFSALRCLTPRGTHAKARDAAAGRFASDADNAVGIEEALPRNRRVVVRTLRTVGAVL